MATVISDDMLVKVLAFLDQSFLQMTNVMFGRPRQINLMLQAINRSNIESFPSKLSCYFLSTMSLFKRTLIEIISSSDNILLICLT